VSLSVVIPTIKGREALAQQTVAAFRAAMPGPDLQIVLVKERMTIGRAWNDGVPACEGDYLMLAADDIIPAPGFEAPAMQAADQDYWPAPNLINADGSVLATGSMGGGWLLTGCSDFAPVVSSQFPFMRREVWSEIGPSLEIHYFADDYLAARARSAGLIPAYREGYRLTHLEGLPGREEMVRRHMIDRLAFEQAMSEPRWATTAVTS
jgi:hypothetical protein